MSLSKLYFSASSVLKIWPIKWNFEATAWVWDLRCQVWFISIRVEKIEDISGFNKHWVATSHKCGMGERLRGIPNLDQRQVSQVRTVGKASNRMGKHRGQGQGKNAHYYHHYLTLSWRQQSMHLTREVTSVRIEKEEIKLCPSTNARVSTEKRQSKKSLW